MAPERRLGLDLDALEQTLAANRVKLMFLTPDFHNPTGLSMSLAARRRLLEIASRHQVPIVEDHIYARLLARGERLPSLKQLDRANVVMQIDSVSKIAFPGLRVGWVVAPTNVIERLRVVKQSTDLHTDQLSQAALARVYAAWTAGTARGTHAQALRVAAGGSGRGPGAAHACGNALDASDRRNVHLARNCRPDSMPMNCWCGHANAALFLLPGDISTCRARSRIRCG